MGALHQGHISLITQALKECDTVVVSIFVNPKQFNNADDLAKYPKTLSSDLKLLEACGVHSVFIPDVDEVYKQNQSVVLDISPLDRAFEGEFRPGHFQGVVDVLFHLFRIVQPSDVYFGLKDLQQCMVVEKLLSHFFSNVNQHNCETLREPNGLAMSSRNMRLSDSGKNSASAIYKALTHVKQHAGNNVNLMAELKNELTSKGIETEYLNLVDLPNLTVNDFVDPLKRQAVVFAGYLEKVRLIDNVLV